MSISPKSAFLVITVVAALGCMGAPAAPAAPAALSAADIAANQALSQSFSKHMVAKEWDAAALLYTESAVLLPSNSQALHGRAAVKGFVQGFPPLAELTLTIDTLVGEGKLAYAVGRYHLTLDLKGSPVDSGTFLDVREKQADGSWLYAADMFHSSAPLPAPR